MHKKIPKYFYYIDNFDLENIKNIKKDTAVIFRNYKNNTNKDLLIKIRNYLKIRKIKFILANDIKLAICLKLDGAYIPSFNKSVKHLNFYIKKDFLFIGSAHNLKEIRMKEIQRCDAIFISSIFKKNTNYLGINRFNLISKLTNKKVIALGGISKKNLKQIKLTSASGFAGISYFKKKAPYINKGL
tara:strand:+ start:1839 stop:2396 length:558 start_codon:yes stop_codon:yes gene_type:complete